MSEKGGFQLVQTLGLLGMYFDAVVVEVKKNLLLFRLAMACNAYIGLFFLQSQEVPIGTQKIRRT